MYGAMQCSCLQDRFLAGLKHYLEQHAYNNTRAPDLWAALAGKPAQPPAAAAAP